ncbi:hypothetical protein [Clostridium butyricum]|uniref:Putative liporotein n=1 Tax=Clostridium butyricum E4 str. BoNT E BL5262 TaxID=632245 RepID=C4ILS5_CLOBU|nr:hypothetical protein [Clostridium butyricum]EDT74703.1 putative lipoprotein [Clostridium butyricum 5521]EEP52864.1 putative liporotein [Clostridium butyricum E4 str. BoNT E BL5262]NFL29895.1 hypothetical protein [Clostridium butyricum]NFS17498.1 hypothetical protein [Clostridium butyricum]
MKSIRKRITIGLTAAMMMAFTGCANKQEAGQSMNNFRFVVESKQEFDYIKLKLGEFETKIEPMHDDTKVKEGYVSNIALDEEKDVKFSIEVVNDNETLLNKDDIKLDLSEGKSVNVNLVDKKDNSIDIEIK